jgi:hypothetical protein
MPLVHETKKKKNPPKRLISHGKCKHWGNSSTGMNMMVFPFRDKGIDPAVEQLLVHLDVEIWICHAASKSLGQHKYIL